MFTGLIETIGIIARRRTVQDGMSFQIDCHFDSGELQSGESIAVDGVCVTVEDFSPRGFSFSASAETLQRGTIGRKPEGSRVHLERALRLGDRLGGHFVQGHVDGIGRVQQLIPRGEGADLIVGVPESLKRYVVEKGPLAVQGVSLTVAGIKADTATIALIPATLRGTYWGELKPGDELNLEVDVLAKYIESFMPNKGGDIDQEKLRRWGFG